MISANKGILTIAIGKKYVKQAKYLAYSCMLNSPHTLRAVITDSSELLNNFYDIIIPFTDSDDPFSLKTRLYNFTPFFKTLYLDADSLVFHPVDDFWNYLDEKSYIYEGKKLISDNWYFDIKETCNKLSISWIPKFNSGMMLFCKNNIVKDIFDTAYYYFTNNQKENINILPIYKNNYPDEPFLAISLAKNDIEPIDDYSRFSRTLINTRLIRLNIIKKVAYFIKDDIIRHPLIVHFCGRKGALFYFKEKLRLYIRFFPHPLL